MCHDSTTLFAERDGAVWQPASARLPSGQIGMFLGKSLCLVPHRPHPRSPKSIPFYRHLCPHLCRAFVANWLCENAAETALAADNGKAHKSVCLALVAIEMGRQYPSGLSMLFAATNPKFNGTKQRPFYPSLACCCKLQCKSLSAKHRCAQWLNVYYGLYDAKSPPRTTTTTATKSSRREPTI